jgi:hypothetical protein
MKIQLLLKRGLGNQFFQYAAGLFFARKYGASLTIVREPAKFAISFGRPRPFLLSRFSISTPVRDLTAWDRLMCSVAPSKKPIVASARLLSRTAYYAQNYMDDWTFLPTLPIPSSTQTLYLEGNFQAWQYPHDVEETIRRELQVKAPAEGPNLEMLQQIRGEENSVSLHLRRGDYVVRSEGPQVMPLTYYEKAIQTIQDRVQKPRFFVFSDDIPFARQNLPQTERITFVEINDEAAPEQDLRLMMACRHNIIANSTFSWWGAWLNPNPAKLVIAPESWENINKDVPYPDLIPSGWLRIPLSRPPATPDPSPAPQ